MRLGLSAAAVLAGCYNPTIPAGAACNNACPGDLECIEHRCVPPGGMPPEPDASPIIIDAAVDARTIDGPPGDVDGDGFADNVDNCSQILNVDQHDEDADSIGDVCDPCPHIAGTAADQDGDGVGDACDPQPTVAKQHIKFFDPFTSTKSQWMPSSGTSLVGETMRLLGVVNNSAFTRLGVSTGELRIETAGTVVTSDAASSPHQLSVAFGFTGSSYHYVEFYDSGGSSGNVCIVKYDGTSYTGVDCTPYTGILPTGAFSMRIDESVAAQKIDFQATLGGAVKPLLTGATNAIPPNLVTSSTMTLHAQNADFRFNYWIVIETLP
ncbi:MAG TPA: thrombospondin type 3 repeat-containing protein [Kofleriaceae bacterium]|nr:thrombospondin type 3 repeat-containing protein [Kofleriaceae bacterium]